MITDLENRVRTALLDWGYSYKDLMVAGGIVLFVGFVSFSGVIAMKKNANLAHYDVLAGVPVKGAKRSGEYSQVDDVPVALEPLPAEGSYQGAPKDLQPPYLSKAPGSFLESEFPIRLSISNPNDSSTWIMYSVSGRQFTRYAGSSISIRARGHLASLCSGGYPGVE